MHSSKIIALVVNCVLPGVGTIIAGKKKEGIIQVVLAVISLPLMIVLIGIPLALGVWVWSIISVATMDDSEFEKK
jgi:hypothetical protein